MVDKFNKHWSVIHGVMGVVTILDSRFTLKFPKIYGHSAQYEIKRIQGICFDLSCEYQSKQEVRQGQSFFSSYSSQLDAPDSIDCDLDAFFKHMEEEVSNSQGKTELDNYLDKKNLPKTLDFNVLAWWKSNGSKYHVL
ncbi:Dimer_Tnp_hAT domain-containing protein [Cephalotus follicularis]|uniref:Dimer_Tnp_hAT domain-containing protein n=1 Tax=Cephalotus follicularis TaxID=3775 RepID=A0A1Q3B3B6_CEPFO|nr:Dimer_Tnp_hAT domain-containing protein [Cephalotus follicularis]